MKVLPFRFKIALLSTLISGVVLVGFGIAGFLMIARERTAALDAEIRALGTRHPGWIQNRRDFGRLDESLRFVFGDGHGEDVILMVTDAGGEVLHTSAGWPEHLAAAKLPLPLADDPAAPPEVPDSRGDAGFRGGRGWGGPGRGMGPGGGPGGGPVTFTKIPRFVTADTAAGVWRLGMMGTADTTLVIGLSTRRTHAELQRLRDAFLMSLPVALSLVGLGGWIVAGRALRPLRTIAATAEPVTARGLDQRIPLHRGDPEIARVIQVLNRMMDRLESSFQQATRFSADASHELKTPLAIMQGELEIALQEAAPGSPAQQVFGNLLEETQRLKTITSGLLLLARADAGQLKPDLQTVDLTLMLEGMVDDLKVLAEPSRLDFEADLGAGIAVLADPALLRTALLNLFSNAVKYNEPGGLVRARLTARGEQVVFELGNSGPGIPEADQARIFTRFHRGDSARQRTIDGVGLGLSLAREIARAHGGELKLLQSRDGWTSFGLTLRRAGSPA
jgi:heavy metal sensor kinase